VALLGSLATLLALAGCVTASPPPSESNGVYTLWAQYGLTAGNWDRAEHDAIARAQGFCADKGLVYRLVKEEKTGTPGATALRSTVWFRCEREFAQVTATLNADCNEQMSDPALDPIRSKIELSGAAADAPPPFQIAADDSYPTELERQAIAKWAALRDACSARQREASRVPPSTPPLRATYLEQANAFADQIAGKIGALTVALYQDKLTYGEFAQKRYDFARDGAAAEREFRQATLISDPQRAMQAEQLALQNFQLMLAGWNTYLQSVSARAPRPAADTGGKVTAH